MAIYEYSCKRCGKFRRVYRADWQAHPRFCSRNCATKRPEDIWDEVDKSGGPDACWPFIGARDKDGYGRYCFGGKRVRAHRITFELTYGKIPEGHLVRHVRCDNPPCCNPRHLKSGLEFENSADMVAAKRSLAGNWNPAHLKPETLQRGEGHHNAKLNDSVVREIRQSAANGETGASIARRLSVHRMAVYRVIRGEYWRHVA